MFVAALWPTVLGALVAVAHAKPTRTVSLSKRAPSSPQFVSTDSGHFVVNGSRLNFVGTNAYWLHALNEDDIDKTLGNISASGIKVVRTWAFNDVSDIPENGTWFQQIKDGKISLNEGSNGLQKLDKVVQLAQKHGVYLILSLTNNWNPNPLLDGTGNATVTTGANNKTLARNSLSNDYGGMDTYVRGFGLRQHDQFYTNATLINAFKNYTGEIAKRYFESTSVFGWELANDARCNSTLPAGVCNPQDITEWHATIAAHIRSIDTNHLVSSGTGGFFCVDCPKLFPLPTAPAPQASAVPGTPRRRAPQLLTRAKVLRDRAETWKKNRELQGRSPEGVRIRGRWTSTPTRRQADTQAVGSAFDGSFGVDSQDILNIPNVDFGSFQLFPDQTSYGVDNPSLSPFQNNVDQGNSWIQQQGTAASDAGKPITLSAFGLVTQDNAANFVPFDSASAPFASDSGGAQAPFGITDQQRDDAYSSWIDTGLTSGLTSMVQYQWGQGGLTVSAGTPVTTSSGTTGIDTSPGSTGISPNDGYSINGQGYQGAVNVIQQGIASFGSDASLKRR